jgi:hypothetical protein
MIMRSFMALTPASALALVLLAAGCGNERQCGSGTHDVNGVCVQDNPMDCDPKTAVPVDGVCKAKQAGSVCGPGTKQNPSNPEECIPDCGAGTSLDPFTKKCVPDNSLIEPNVVEKPSDEDNDPMNPGGVPIPFTLPGPSESIIIAGVIGAPVEDSEGVPWADFDGWKFSTQGPTLLEIEGLDVSHIRAAFWIAPADDATAVQRFGFNAEANQAHRKLFVPTSGDWVLMVSDADNFNAWFNQSFDAPVGADDSTFNYAVRITRLGQPGYDNLAPATPMLGSYEGGPRFYSLVPTSGQVVEFWNTPTAGDVYPATAFFSPQATYKRTSFDPLTLARGGTDTLCFAADLAGALGSNLAVTYEAKVLTPEDLGALSGASARIAVGLGVAESKYYTLTVAGGGVILVTATAAAGSTMTPAVALYDAAMTAIVPLTTVPTPAYVPGTGTGEYVVRVTDADGGGGSGYAFDLRITGGPTSATPEVEPNDAAGTATAASGFPAYFAGILASDTDKDYYQITLVTTTNLLLLTTADPVLGMDTLLELFDSTGDTKLAENDDIDDVFCLFGDAASCLSRLERTSLDPGTYVVAISSAVGTTGAYQLVAIAE